jgi:hypothetical protein
MNHPMDFPEQTQVYPGADTIVPGSPYKKIPIRLNADEKLLSLIGFDLG